MIWRARARWVMRVGDTYWILDQLGAVLSRHEPMRFEEGGDMYFVDHYVRRHELVERTARGGRWGRIAHVATLERDLRVDTSEGAKDFLESLISQLPEARRVLDRILEPTAQTTLEFRQILSELEHGEDFRRAHDALLDHVERTEDLYTRILRIMVALGRENPSAASLTAFARAALVLCKQDDPPAIDEESVSVISPLAAHVAELAALLDDENYGDAADAMHTCALLLGHRVAK